MTTAPRERDVVEARDRAGARWAEVRRAAADLGFSAVAATTVDPLSEDGLALAAWCGSGFAGDMAYMRRGPGLLATPRRLAPAALSILTLSVDHASGPAPARDPRRGRVARYAWGRDYHDVVRPRLDALVARVAAAEGRPVAARTFTDAVPLLERAVAARAGLGFVGKNTNLLREGTGSWFFLAEVLLDVALPPTGAPPSSSCGTCRRCLDACPTGAFEGPYRLDARRCISYLTIESRGPVPAALRPLVGDWVFGCDVCQEVCPFNRFARDDAWPELRADAGVGPTLDLVETLSIEGDGEFRARFRGTALLRPRRAGLLRNAAVAAGNAGCEAAVPVLARLAILDPEPLVRGHALWALARLDSARARAVAERASRDPDAFVREEARRALGEVCDVGEILDVVEVGAVEPSARRAPAPPGRDARTVGTGGPGGYLVGPPQEPPMAKAAIRVTSPAFAPNARVPRRHAYEGEGQNVSPALSWAGVPAGAKELALVCDDPDAPRPEPWVHWVVYRIPAGAAGLPEGLERAAGPLENPPGAMQGKNTWEALGWGGPLPPAGHGVHHYRFRLYALDTHLQLMPGATKAALLSAIEGHVVGEGELVGTYERR